MMWPCCAQIGRNVPLYNDKAEAMVAHLEAQE